MGSLVKVVDRNYLIRQFQNYDTNVVAPQIQDLDERKVDKVAGYGLSKNDFTDAYKQKLDSLSNYNDSELTERVSNVELVIQTLQSDVATEGSIAKMTHDAVAEIVANAPSDFDTLKEISDWISGHADSAAAMNSQIQANTSANENNSSRIDQLETQLNGLDLSIESVDIDFNDLYGDGNSDITLTADSDTITVGETTNISSNVADVEFSVDDETKATINENGLLTAIDPGTVVVSATKYGHTTGTKSIVILPVQEPGPEEPPEEPNNEPENPDPGLGQDPEVQIVGEASVMVGKTVKLTSNAPNTVWTSGDDSIASVDDNGVVTGVAAGEVTITASAPGYANGYKGITVLVEEANNPDEPGFETNGDSGVDDVGDDDVGNGGSEDEDLDDEPNGDAPTMNEEPEEP